MRPVVHILQSGGADMGIHLSRRKLRVAEQFLDEPQVGPRVEQMRRVGVPELVRGESSGSPASARYRFRRSWTDRTVIRRPAGVVRTGSEVPVAFAHSSLNLQRTAIATCPSGQSRSLPPLPRTRATPEATSIAP